MRRVYNKAVPGTHEPCTVCGDASRFLRTRGPHIGEYCANGHQIGDWIGTEHFSEGGDRYGQLPPEDFSKARKRRAKKHQLVEHIRVALQSETACFFCQTEKFEGPMQARIVKDWIQRWRPSVYARLLRRFRIRGNNAMVRIPPDWPTHIDAALYDTIRKELADSNIQGDHLIPVHLLELLEPNGEITTEMLDFAGRRLGIPLCERCNRGRHLAGLEPPTVLLNRWTKYYFNGNSDAARRDDRWTTVESLARAAYKIERALQRVGAPLI